MTAPAWLETKEVLINQFSSDASSGLTAEQAKINIGRFGPNTLSRSKPDTFSRRLKDAVTEPMIVMLSAAWLIATGISIFQHFTDGSGEFLECAGIFCAIFLSVIINVIMEGKSAKAFEALAKINDNITVRAVRDGATVKLNQDEIAAGDILLVATGDKLPADGRLLETSDLAANESILTGESLPAEKDASFSAADEKTPLAERANMLYAGTYITNGFGKMIVTATGDRTEFGRIVPDVVKAKRTLTPLQEKLARFGKTVTIIGVIATAVVFLVQLLTFYRQGILTLDAVVEIFLTSVTLIVSIVPEGLPTIIAIALSINVTKLSGQNMLIKKLVASETIGSVNVICSDKTGTLTENRMTVCGFYDTAWHTDISEFSSVWLAHNFCLNTTADIGENGAFLGNPTECALLAFHQKLTPEQKEGQSYREERRNHETLTRFPFSSELKHMTTVSCVDGHIVSYVKGSPETVFSMCGLPEEKIADIEKYITAAQEKSMRIIAFAHKVLPAMKDFHDEEHHREMETGMVFDGFVAIADPLREDVRAAVASCRNAGVSLKILTGDNIVTAQAIANELKLLENGAKAVEAKDIEEMSDAELSEMLPSIAVIARNSPGTKMRVVKLLKEAGNVVAVTGDGINDAPALKHADIGIAMGISGTEVTKESSDIVLLDDSFSTIAKAIEWGRNIYDNFRRFIIFQLTANLAAVLTVLASVLIGLKSPFTAMELLWVNIIMDGPAALTLGLEPSRGDVMSRKPVNRNENIISRPMMAKIALTAVFMSAVIVGQYIFNFMGADEKEMTTVLFTLFVLFQLFNAFNARELHEKSIFANLFGNRLMLFALAVTFVLQILIIEFAGPFFKTVPLETAMWGKIIAVSFAVIIASECIKLLLRVFRQREA